MTERGRAALQRDSGTLSIGPSAMTWDGSALVFRLDEVTAPIPSRVRGTVRVYPSALTPHVEAIDAAGQHRWSPLAPLAHVEVALDQPNLRWSGSGYLDSNDGDVPLESSFARWDWSRSGLRREACVFYDVAYREGGGRTLALRFDRSGAVAAMEPPPRFALPVTAWRVRRATRVDTGASARIAKPLEDAPFYARCVLSTRVFGEPAMAVHESLSLDRFAAPWVQAMLPFRMPRRRL
jgi:carotenoid 1,2-hydratase